LNSNLTQSIAVTYCTAERHPLTHLFTITCYKSKIRRMRDRSLLSIN